MDTSRSPIPGQFQSTRKTASPCTAPHPVYRPESSCFSAYVSQNIASSPRASACGSVFPPFSSGRPPAFPPALLPELSQSPRDTQAPGFPQILQIGLCKNGNLVFLCAHDFSACIDGIFPCLRPSPRTGTFLYSVMCITECLYFGTSMSLPFYGMIFR